jgi:hypothetical protein
MLLSVPSPASPGSVRQPRGRLRPAPIVTSAVTTVPIPPLRTSVAISASPSWNRVWKVTPSRTPADRHSATQRRALSAVSASGLSHSTCLPARAAAITSSLCSAFGVAM